MPKQKEKKKPRAPRKANRIDAEDTRFASLPPAIVNGMLIAAQNDIVHVLRYRVGKNSWHKCRVFKIENTWIELWDEILEQKFCFDSAQNPPDVRLNG